ncbi:MAG TPA: hypothetical protein VKY92_15495 [Verrucomicrobiae bacterium]|nr:hypothetical protein [Verrucomicrobiae bacterium]
MSIKYKEDPAAWRKSTLLSLLGVAVLSAVLRWRHVLSPVGWAAVMGLLPCLTAATLLKPEWFRGYYRFSTWAGFWSSQGVARVALAVVFVLFITPAAILMRLMGKDPLQLKRSPEATSYWRPARQDSSLDRSF